MTTFADFNRVQPRAPRCVASHYVVSHILTLCLAGHRADQAGSLEDRESRLSAKSVPPENYDISTRYLKDSCSSSELWRLVFIYLNNVYAAPRRIELRPEG